MVKRLIWTDKYNKSLEYIFSCSRDIYSRPILSKLKSAIMHNEKLLSHNPLMGSIEESLQGMEYEYRKIVIKPYFKIIYRVDNDVIYFIKIWDTRRDPSLLVNNF